MLWATVRLKTGADKLREEPCPERAVFFALPNTVSVLDRMTLRFWLALLQY